MSERPLLHGLSFSELASLLGEEDRPSITRARAMSHWLWRPEATLEALPENIPMGVSRGVMDRIRPLVGIPEVVEVGRRVSQDGTIKLLLEARGAPIEAVMIPGMGRVTVCISSQSGCSRQCAFCATARMGFGRNLEAGELVAQVLLARNAAPAGLRVRNVVFMGMGEPLDNLEEVLKAVEALRNSAGAGLSGAHITVSTSGVLPRMRAFLEASDAELALSLNGSTEAQREAVMPINRRYPLEEVLGLMREYSDRRLFLVEYILMGGFNDSLEDAARLVQLLQGITLRVNLIPFNPFPGAGFARPKPEAVDAFFKYMNGAGIRTMLRMPRGDDIAAACGQLARQRGLEGEGAGAVV